MRTTEEALAAETYDQIKKIGIDYDGWEEEEGRLARSCAEYLLFCPSRSILHPSPPSFQPWGLTWINCSSSSRSLALGLLATFVQFQRPRGKEGRSGYLFLWFPLCWTAGWLRPWPLV